MRCQFEGQLQYKTECLTCGYISERSGESEVMSRPIREANSNMFCLFKESFLEIEISMEVSDKQL